MLLRVHLRPVMNEKRVKSGVLAFFVAADTERVRGFYCFSSVMMSGTLLLIWVVNSGGRKALTLSFILRHHARNGAHVSYTT